jgi:hypothetical protein
MARAESMAIGPPVTARFIGAVAPGHTDGSVDFTFSIHARNIFNGRFYKLAFRMSEVLGFPKQERTNFLFKTRTRRSSFKSVRQQISAADRMIDELSSLYLLISLV